MIITYHGGGFVKIQHGDLAVAWNPNGLNQIKIGGKAPFVINGPGEYEVSNIFIRGFETTGPNETLNTVYVLSLDGLRLAHWGVLGEAKIPEVVSSGIGEVDVLFVPLDLPAGGASLTPVAAYKLALTFQPKIIVPLSESDTLIRQFLKEAGAEEVKPIDKFVFKKKDVAEKEGEVIVLSAI